MPEAVPSHAPVSGLNVSGQDPEVTTVCEGVRLRNRVSRNLGQCFTLFNLSLASYAEDMG